jgi:hypothetical protein
MPEVRAVMARAACRASSVSVSELTSAKTASQPSQTMLEVVATYENGVVTTSPRHPRARITSWMAMVPLLVKITCSTPRYAASRASSSVTSGPSLVSHTRDHTPSSRAA